MDYSKQAKRAITGASKLSKTLNHSYVGTEHLLIDNRAHSVTCTSRVAVLEFLAADDFRPGFHDSHTNEFLQGFLSLGIRGESLFENLLLLQNYCVVYFE